MKLLAQLCLIAGLISIPLSICMWGWGPELSATTIDTVDRDAHKERWGIFVGLWAPTFLILSQILRTCDRECRDAKSLAVRT